MRLAVPIPNEWRQQIVAEGVLVESPNARLGMLITAIGPAQPDPDVWLHRAFMHRAGSAVPRNLAVAPFSTEAGWAGMLLVGELGTQERLVVYLAFIDYAAMVVATCTAPAELPTWRTEILAMIVHATLNLEPDDGVACLAHLLGEPPPTPGDARTHQPILGWQRTLGERQLVLTTTASDAGTIRVTTDLAPLRPVSQLFDGFEAPRVITTDEGEHAVIAHRIDAGLQSLAVVFGDVSYTRIDAESSEPELFDLFRATVDELAFSATLGLGSARWRRFYYEPPVGWRAIARPHATLWLSPACPRQYQVMYVFDARLRAAHESVYGLRMFETLPLEFFEAEPKGRAIYYAADDLEVHLNVYTAQLAKPLKVLDAVVLSEDYAYPIRIECEATLLEDSIRVFDRVVATLRRVPNCRRRTGNIAAVSFWAE